MHVGYMGAPGMGYYGEAPEHYGYYAEPDHMGYYAEPADHMGYYGEAPEHYGYYAEPDHMGMYASVPEMVGYGDDRAMGGYAADLSGYVRDAPPRFNAGCPLPTNLSGFGDIGDVSGYTKPADVSPNCQQFTSPSPSQGSLPDTLRPLW